MELKNQVCSLEIDKKLKSLNVKQESLFYHQVGIDTVIVRQDAKDLGEENMPNLKYFSAFTVAELGEMLPDLTKCWRYEYMDTNVGLPKWNWHCEFKNIEHSDITEADARGKMLIYLLENKLITL